MTRRTVNQPTERFATRAVEPQVMYEPTDRERAPIEPYSEAEPRLGPYETRYTVQLGYASPPRAVA